MTTTTDDDDETAQVAGAAEPTEPAEPNEPSPGDGSAGDAPRARADAAETAVAADAPPAGAAPAERSPGRATRWWRAVRREWPLALELVAVTSFVFARPTLASLGRSPETFLSRGADWYQVALFAVLLVVVPALVAIAVDVAGNLAGPRVRTLVHAALLGALFALAAWQIGEQFTADMRLLPVGGPLCVAVGLGAAALRYSSDAFATFLRYASVAALVFLGQFLFASPSAALVLGGRHVGLDPEVTAVVSEAVGEDAPPVVVLVFDGMPTELLLDGEGRIDAGLYPNLAELVGTSTWSRNHTTVAPVTLKAIPAIVSGRLNDETVAPVTSEYPHNLFTLLGGVYDVHADEPITGLCPVGVCPLPDASPFGDLVGDATDVWKLQVRGLPAPEHFIPGAFDDRYGRFSDWIDAQDFRRGDRPDAFFLHSMLPHDPWGYLPDGSRYGALGGPTGLFADMWGDAGTAVGRQRHVLHMQASDRLVGQLMDEMQAAGTFDDALVVVTADHGYAFEPNSSMRGASEENFDEILWTPLIVKAPGQDAPEVDDRNVLTIDILPTIADTLGIDLPWDDVEGVPATEADRDPADKSIADWGWNTLPADDDGIAHVDGEEGFERVLETAAVTGDGPLAFWDRTDGAHGDLVGTQVDDLSAGEPREEVIDVQRLDMWRDVDLDRPPLEVMGTGFLPLDVSVAIAVDGTVAAVVPPDATPYGVSAVHGLLWPEALSEGDNEITMYVVDGPATEPVLHELAVRGRG